MQIFKNLFTLLYSSFFFWWWSIVSLPFPDSQPRAHFCAVSVGPFIFFIYFYIFLFIFWPFTAVTIEECGRHGDELANCSNFLEIY